MLKLLLVAALTLASCSRDVRTQPVVGDYQIKVSEPVPKEEFDSTIDKYRKDGWVYYGIEQVTREKNKYLLIFRKPVSN